MEQEADAGLELGRGAFERRVGRAVVRALERGIGNAPVHEVGVRRELGADLADPVAQRDHDVEALRDELVEVLGAVRADVDAALLHHPHRVGMQRLRMAARATRPRPCPSDIVLEQRLGDLRPCAVPGAQEQDPRPATPATRRRGASAAAPARATAPGCSAPPAACSCSRQRDEIDGVVAVPSIGRAATRRHEPARRAADAGGTTPGSAARRPAPSTPDTARSLRTSSRSSRHRTGCATSRTNPGGPPAPGVASDARFHNARDVPARP